MGPQNSLTRSEAAQKLETINVELERVCDDLQVLLVKIKDCIANNTDLPRSDTEKMLDLNKQFNKGMADAKAIYDLFPTLIPKHEVR